MSEELKAGDTVRVKSGGADMTITNIADDYGTLTAWCVWHDGKKKMEDTFPVVSLVKVEERKPKTTTAPKIRFTKLIPPGSV